MRFSTAFSFRKLFLLFWLLVLLLYGIAWRSGMERDFHGLFELYYNHSFADMINRKGAGNISLYQVTQLQLWFWTTLFGTRLLPWFLLQTGLYAAAAASVTHFLRQVYNDFNWTYGSQIAFWGGVLSLVVPQNAEIVVWKASYHYPVAVLILFGILALFRRFLLTGHQKFLLWAVLLYAVSTYTLELFYATIPLAGLLLLIYRNHPRVVSGSLRRAWVWGIGSMLVLFGLHFIAYRLVYHGVVPHAEDAVKEALEEPLRTFGRLFHIEYNLLFQARYWPNEWYHKPYAWAEKPVAGIVGLLLLIGIIVSSVFMIIRRPKTAPIALLVAGAFLGIALILPSPVMRDGIYYNDRLLYFTGLFQWQLVALFAFRIAGRKGMFLVVGFTLILASLTFYTALQCSRAATVFWKAIDTFRWKKEQENFLLLNVPANYKWIVMYQEGPENNEFASHIQIFRKDTVAGKLHAIAGYNMNHPEEGARVLVVDRTHLYVTLTGAGAWYWNRSLGASDHENAYYKMKLDEWYHQYHLELKDTNTRLLYFNQLQWKEVDFNRTGDEQE